MKQQLKEPLRILIYPVIRYFGPRFQNIHARLDTLISRLSVLDQIKDHLTAVENRVAGMEARLSDFEKHISTDIDTAVEVLLTNQRAAAMLQERLAQLQRLLDSESAKQILEQGREMNAYEARITSANGPVEQAVSIDDE